MINGFSHFLFTPKEMLIAGKIDEHFLNDLLMGREHDVNGSYMLFATELLPKLVTKSEWDNLALDEYLLRDAVTTACEATAILFIENAWDQAREFAAMAPETRAQPRKKIKFNTVRRYSTGIGAKAKADGGWNSAGTARFNALYNQTRLDRTKGKEKDAEGIIGTQSFDKKLKDEIMKLGYGRNKRHKTVAQLSQSDSIMISAMQANIDDEAALFIGRKSLTEV